MGSQKDRSDFEEKRQSPRIKKAITVQYSVKDLPQAGVDMSQTKDISEEGISFTISNPLALQTILNIKLNIPISEDSLELEAQVSSCREIRPNIVYSVGVKFINLSEEQKRLLKDFVQLFKKS